MNIITVKNYEELSSMAAHILAAQVIAKPDSVLGLATGSTPSASMTAWQSGAQTER